MVYLNTQAYSFKWKIEVYCFNTINPFHLKQKVDTTWWPQIQDVVKMY